MLLRALAAALEGVKRVKLQPGGSSTTLPTGRSGADIKE